MWQPQQITNRYQVISKLGEGGMGAVYQVYDRLEKGNIALKLVNAQPDDLQFASKGTLENKKAAIIQEFSILASLRHPHIISVLDYGLLDGQPYFTMELALQAQNFLQATQRLSPPEQIELLMQVLEALRYLHRRGVIHRDLKPYNVLVLEGNHVKVVDFGLSIDAKVATGRAGTLMYMAPETIKNQIAVPQSDLYAVGVMAYQMIAGVLPFAPHDIMGIVGKIPDMVKLGDHPVAPVVERLLLKDPEDRYLSADESIHAFQEAMNLPIQVESVTVRESFLQASKFVGRDAELKVLTHKLDFVLQSHTAFYLIGGESGVGKSRLMDELRIQALVVGTTVLRGQAIENGRPFQLWRNIVRRLLLTVEVTELQAGILLDIVPDIGNILGRNVEKAPELKGKAYQDRLMLTIVDLFHNINQPIVLLLEDLHWAGESIVVLKQLLRVQNLLHHLMVIATYRNDEAPNLPDDLSGMELMRLDRLTRAAMQDLTSSMLGQESANKHILDLLQRETEGNLFFLVETVRALAEEAGSLELVGKVTLPNHVFTGGMQQIVRRKLYRVDIQHRHIQKLAAVIGREIDVNLLAHQYDYSQVEEWLIQAAGASVIDVQDNTWRFAHDKLREAVLAEIHNDELNELHRSAALCIEAVYPDDENYNETLLEHWRYVGDIDKIYQYILPVTRYLIGITGDYATAQKLLEQLLAQIPGDDARCAPLLIRLATKHELQGNYAEAVDYAHKARQLSEMVNDLQRLGESLSVVANITRFQGNYTEATGLYQQCIHVFQRTADNIGVAQSLSSMGVIASRQGDYPQATELYQQSLAILQDIGDQRRIVMNLNGLAVIAAHQGNNARAMDLFEQCLHILQDIGDRRGVAQALLNLGIMAKEAGVYQHANDLVEQSLDIARQLGDRRNMAHILDSLGLVAKNQGDYQRAIDILQEALEIYQDLGIQDGAASTLANIGLVMQAQNDYERALSFYRQSLAMHQNLGEKQNVAINLFHIGWITFFQEGVSHAVPYFVESLQIVHDINMPTYQLNNVIGFALILNKQGQWLRAGELLGLVQQHSALTTEMLTDLNIARHQVEVRLSPQDMQDVLERGTKLDLDTVVLELLSEFSEAPSR